MGGSLVNKCTHYAFPHSPDGTSWQPSEWTRICSYHFVGNCKSDLSRHPSYIPTVFPPEYGRTAPDEGRAQRWWKHLDQVTPSKDHTGAAVQVPETPNDIQLQEQDKVDVCDTFPELARSQRAECHDSSHTAASVIGKTSEGTDVACQTENSTSGKLTFFLSATNGIEASNQVTHAEQSDKLQVP